MRPGSAERYRYHLFISENGKPARAGFPYDCPSPAEAQQMNELHIQVVQPTAE